MATRFIRQTRPPDNQRCLSERVSALPAVGRLMRDGFIDNVAGTPGRPDRGNDGEDDNHNRDGTRKDGHGRKPRYKVELLCRSYGGDVGIRPIPQQSNIVFWESPDIWIEGPSGNPDLAAPGVVNQVKVKVWNLGLATCHNAQVDLVWCNPSVGLNAAGATPIGQKVIPLLASGQHTTVSFDWTPVVVNNGHECLFAHVYDPLNDPVVAPFNPVWDRHVGQHNIDLVLAQKGQTITFDFFAANFTRFAVNTTVELQKLEGQALNAFALTLGRRAWVPAGATDAGLTPPARAALPLPPHAKLLATRGVFRETLQDQPGQSETKQVMGVFQGLFASRQGERVQPASVAGRASAATRPAAPAVIRAAVRAELSSDAVLDVRIPAREHVRMSLQATVPVTAPRGSADVYRIIERTAGLVTGGLTVIVETR
jgi:hypothetical protein